MVILDARWRVLEGRAREEFREEILRLHAVAETTLLISTDDPRDALATADRVAVIDLGRIVQVDAPSIVYNRPADTFVAQVTGPTNLLQGHIEGTDSGGEAVVRTPVGRLVGRASEAPLPGGSPVAVAIRPESLVFGPAAPAGLGTNRIATTIERQVFLGEVRRIHLRGPNDWPLVALALQSQSTDLREGQSLTVTVVPELRRDPADKFALPGLSVPASRRPGTSNRARDRVQLSSTPEPSRRRRKRPSVRIDPLLGSPVRSHWPSISSPSAFEQSPVVDLLILAGDPDPSAPTR